MRVGDIRELIKDLPDDAQIFGIHMDRTEANEHIFNNFEYGETQPEITDEEWQKVVYEMQADDGIWEQVADSFNWQMDKIENARKAVIK
jgi:hypothetical protein